MNIPVTGLDVSLHDKISNEGKSQQGNIFGTDFDTKLVTHEHNKAKITRMLR